MRTALLFLLLQAAVFASGQERCASADYRATQVMANRLEAERVLASENFLQQQSVSISAGARTASTEITTVFKIPVVVHLLWNNGSQNLSDEQVKSAIGALNRDFRRQNADTLNTPLRFRHLAADVQIEFHLATADPKGRATNGIVRKYTSAAAWLTNDKIKFSAQGGDDAWDSRSYLNIWVGNLVSGAGYSTPPGSDGSKDGIVITANAFGTIGRSGNYSLSRVAVHEVGHWLGLKHIWGDAQCGDDGIGDTPQQSWYTTACPTDFRTSCNNGEAGDMYMNYMDYTADACMNLFTAGQKMRMRASFAVGGPRETILQSKGLKEPWLEESALSGSSVVAYPNPTSHDITLNLDANRVGQVLRIYGANGLLLKTVTVTTAVQKINLSSFQAGLYFIRGEGVSEKIVKL